MNRDVAVVIGVGGMGLAISRRVGSGRTLVLADVDDATLQAAAECLRGEGHEVSTRMVDVSDAHSVAALADAAAALGAVTHVAHTAGLSSIQAPPDAILRVDLLGVALTLAEFGRVVARGGAGVVISSMAAHMAPPLTRAQQETLATGATTDLLGLPFLAPEKVPDSGTAYSIAKRGNLLRVAAASRIWSARGARINSISPGIISTSMGRQELAGPHGEMMRNMVSASGAKRLGTPDDIANAAAFLLSDRAAFITGTDLLVDGGVIATLHTGQEAGVEEE